MTKLRNALLGTVLVATLMASSSASFAEGTAEQRSACMGDAFRYCSSEIPNVSRITSCMRANFSKLTPACKTAFLKG
jgi:hypothetical protein